MWGRGCEESLQIYTNSIIHLKLLYWDKEACADSVDPNKMSQSVASDLFATIQQFLDTSGGSQKDVKLLGQVW